MSESNNQPDLIDRELIPSHSRVSYSREIGDAVVIENIFGKAKVRIVRKGDKLHRFLWSAALIGAAIAAVVAWQVWLASQQVESEPEVAPVNTSVTHRTESMPAQPPAASAVE